MAEQGDTSDPYSLGDALPVDTGKLDPGMNVLVSGPSMSGTRQLVFDLLAPTDPTPDPVIVMTTDDPATRIQSQFEDRNVRLGPSTFRVIDASGAPGDDDPAVDHLSSPSDLTGMGVSFTETVDEMGTPPRLRLGFVSISTLLQYVDAERTFSFLHVLSRRASAAGYLGVYSIDPTTHEQRFVNVVTSIFDVAIDIRENDGTRELRVRGLSDVPPEWTAFPYA